MSLLWPPAPLLFFRYFIMALGGKRPGSGRKKGSTTVPQFRAFVSEEDRKTFVEFVLASYMGDMRNRLN